MAARDLSGVDWRGGDQHYFAAHLPTSPRWIPLARGIRTRITSADAGTIRLLHAHAEAVTGFIKDGAAGMAKRHESPLSKPRLGKLPAKFLSKGDGVKTCPVTGEPVDHSVNAVINGRTVYLCCKSCVEVVKKNPQRYLKPRPR